ncbi:MAG: MATE family efflux transporter, partial [Thaumarchaeota archaeon]|nr:MATE family efflux transporter [Nitrososphaerota archaeon]
MNDKPNLTEGNIGDALKKMALPASIGLFFQAMYNLTDAFYAGQLSTTALAGLAVTFPV